MLRRSSLPSRRCRRRRESCLPRCTRRRLHVTATSKRRRRERGPAHGLPDCNHRKGIFHVNIDLARHVARAVFLSSRELGELVPFLKDRLGAEEYAVYATAIGSAIAALQLDVMNK